MNKFVIFLTFNLLLFFLTTALAQTYTYDQSGRVIGITYSDGKEIGYQYDTSGNIASVETVAQVDTTQPTNPPASNSGGGGVRLA